MIDFKRILEENPVVLGPMAGITNKAYREFMKPFGVSISYTEMVSDCGIIYGNKETFRYLDIGENESPIGVQLFGGEKTTLLEALKIIQNKNIKYDFIDINLGCPVNKVVKTNAGSAWLKREDELFEMMSELVKISRTPVTAKIRLGWDDNSINVSKIVTLLVKAGVSMICIHPRTRSQFYSGLARYEEIKNIKKYMKNIPLVISGDIFTLEDAIKWKTYCRADGIMVARGALGNPHLITQIKAYFQNGIILKDSSKEDQIKYLKEYATKLIELKGEEQSIRELKGIATHFIKGFPNSKKLKVSLTTQMNTYEDLIDILNDVEKQLGYF